MPFIDIPTEQTTAATDLILAIQAIAIRCSLGRSSSERTLGKRIWSWIFSLLIVVSTLGAVAHGIQMTARINAAIWIPLYLALGVIIALLAVAAVSHAWNDDLARRFLRPAMCIGVAFFAVTQLWSDSFLLFVLYEGVTMTAALGLYLWCFWRAETRHGSGFLALGLMAGILAAVVDTQSTLQVECVWVFNNHGIFHMVQMPSLLLLAIGLHRSLGPHESPVDSPSRLSVN
jgi:hypothetical protein